MAKPIPLQKPRKTCKLWKLQASCGKDKRTGEYKKVSKRFHGTEKQAERAQLKYEEDVKAGKINLDRKTNFDVLADEWLKEREETVRKGTYRKDEGRVKNLKLYLAKARMCDIDVSMVCLVMKKLATVGGVSGAPLSGTTCEGVFVTLSLIMDYAKREEVIAENPCKALESRKRPKNDTKEKDTLTLDEARMLQEKLLEGEPDARRTGLMLALNCGLSREEFTGLLWTDVDLSNKCIRVKTANTADDDDLMTTKNEYRQRIIPLDERVTNRLREWKERQAAKLKAKGIKATKHMPVVSNPVGELIHPEAFGKWWRRYRAKVGLEEYGLHQLRHTFATILCASGVDIITAAKLMGHCDTTMLARVYAHMVPEYARQAALKVGSVLNGTAEITPVPFVIG